MSHFELFGVPLELGALISAVSFGISFFLISKWLNRQQSDEPFRCRGIPIDLIDDYESCDAAIASFMASSPGVIGMDAEWKPYFDSKSEHKNPVSLLQLSHHKQCLLIRIQKIAAKHNDQVPSSLIELLSDSSIIKTGLNITGDAKKLYEDYGISVRGTVELSQLIKSKCSFYPTIDSAKSNIHRLDELASLLLNVEMKKSKRITLSNWENDPLSTEQVQLYQFGSQ